MDWSTLAAQSLPSLSGGGAMGSSSPSPTGRGVAAATTTAAINHPTTATVHTTPRGPSFGWSSFSHDQQHTAPAAPHPHQEPAFALRSTTLLETDAPSLSPEQLHQQQTPQQDHHKLSVDELIAQHEQELLENVMQAAVEVTRRQTEDLFERQLQQTWQRERSQWTKTTQQQQQYQPEIAGLLPGYSNNAATPLSLSDSTNRRPLPSSFQTQPQSHAIMRLPASTPETSAFLDRYLPALMQAHLDAVSSKGDRPLALVQQLIALPSNIIPPGDVATGYKVMWQFIEELLQLTGSHHSTDRSSSVVDPVEQARAYLIFLCKQTKQYIVDRVRRANLAGQDVTPHNGSSSSSSPYRAHMATMCASFVKLTLGSNTTYSHHANKQTNIDQYWAVAYYCLRCGDAAAAKEVLQGAAKTQLHTPTDADAAVLRIVDAMALVQGNRACFWQGHVAPKLAAQDRQALAVQLERLKNQQAAAATTTTEGAASMDDDSIIHQMGVYTLCCATETLPVSEHVFGFMAVEDYLSGALWKALLAYQPIDELVDFGNVITNYGPAYFGQNLVPLLVSQQYETVLTHLTNTCGRVGCLYAAHLALVLASMGVSLENLNNSRHGNYQSVHGGGSATNLAATLITNYSELLLADRQFGPAAALEYITRIPNKLRASHEVAALIAKTGQTDVLVGSLSKDGIRTGPALLDKHFTPTEIASILSNAASMLLRDKSNQSKMSVAVLCFSLAERYADALALMSELLSPPELEVDACRAFWLKEVELFHTNFLKQQTHVMDVLERENKLSHVTTNQSIVDLNHFFQLRRRGEVEKAWPILERLKLLPTSQQDLTAKINEYHQMDGILKQALPPVIVAAVEMLHSEYKRIHLMGNQPSQQQWALQERQRELKAQIQAIATYTSITGVALSQEQLDNLNRIASVV